MTLIDLYNQLSEKILKDYPSAQISLVDITKKDEKYKGLKIAFDRSYLDPVFNLDKLTERVNNGIDIDVLSQLISKEIKSAIIFSPVDINILNSYDKLKSVLCVDIVSVEENTNWLSNVPHQLFSDNMAIVTKAFLADSKENINKLPVITITNEILNELNVSKDTLIKDAIENSKKINPPEILTVSDFLYGDEYIESPETHLHDNAKIPVRIITTQTGVCGASVMLNQNILEDLARSYGGSFYLIPSSIGCLTIPENFPRAKELAQNIEKVLSDNIMSPNTKQLGGIQHYNQDSRILESEKLFEERNSKLVIEQKKDSKLISEKPKTEKDKELEI